MIKKLITLFYTAVLFSLFTLAYADTTKPIKTKTPKIQTTPNVSPHSSIPVEKEKSPFTGTFDITTNYMLRGISQTNNLPAVQGGLTYTIPRIGIYFNVWGSNVYFPDLYGNTATVELDGIVGVTNKIGENFTYDLSFDRYNYPKTVSESYNELTALLTYYFVTAQISYSNNDYDTGASGIYYNLSASYDIPSKYIFNITNMNIKAGIGHSSLPNREGLRSYNDYSVALSKTIDKYILSLLWTDTNGRSGDPTSLKDSHIVGSVSVSF